MDQAERAAKQIDSGRDDRWPDAVVVEHERFDQIVGVTAVVRRKRRGHRASRL